MSVAGRRFRWRFEGHIVVAPDGLSGRQVLDVDFGWSDPWIHMNDRTDHPPAASPRIVTPAFVAAAIEFALGNGWKTETRGGRFRVTHSAERGFACAVSER